MRVALVELFTSEGCSSCPPAERWLGALRDKPGLWRDFVPAAWHVNYWDRLGWRDVYASKSNTERQYAYARAWGSGSVYTPCVVNNGAEWNWRDALTPSSDATPGNLMVTLTDDGNGAVEFVPMKQSASAYEIHLALLGNGITSQVRAGENAGRALHHEFVVLAMDSAVLAETAPLKFTAVLLLPKNSALHAPQRALAAWVSRRGEVAPVQATGGWLHD